MDGKITKVWFDEALGDIQQEDIPANRVWLKREELTAHTGIWAGPGIAHTLNKSLVLADIQRVIKSLQDDSPTHAPRYLTANLYDRAKAAGYPLDGVMRLAPRYAVQRPPEAAKTRAALHPLIGRLIDKFNKEN